MFCQHCGRYCMRGQLCCTGGRSLIKRNDNAARAPLRIEGPFRSFHVSQNQLARTWPGGFRRAQQLGNSVIRPRDIVGRDFESEIEQDYYNLAMEWLSSRLNPWPKRTYEGYEYSLFDELAGRLRGAMREALLYGDFFDASGKLDNLLDLFGALGLLFNSHGVGTDLKNEVLHMGVEAASLIAREPGALFELIKCMWKMTRDENIMIRMFNAIPPEDQMNLVEYAEQESFAGRDHTVAAKIMAADELIRYRLMDLGG